MSKFNYKEVAGSKRNKGLIEDGMLVYVRIKDGDFKFQSKEKEFSAEIVVDKKTAKAFKKAFPKNKPKEIDTVDFEDKYKVEPPFPDEDEQYIIKLSTSAQISKDIETGGRKIKKGSSIPYKWATRPKVYQPNEDGEGVIDITLDADKLPANGSVGSLAFITTSNDFGTFPKLDGVLVTSLIPYEGGAGSAFGKVVGGPDVPDEFEEAEEEEENQEEEVQTPDNSDEFDSVDDEEESEEEESDHPFG